ncbi:hypothetical protein [Acinetobacter rongchengensis]|uniref:Uncharacterized protein n=1 Tax=Acinetobacter rongchengensis TaxID=2419601 RepID=A0A3A8EZ28_9GAMM|nr:hypothetical protein [Acinetobacter rongchengensis]RKG38746.1 hypothetical protein D7V20_07005 [Acinetobacter rongchengensis]
MSTSTSMTVMKTTLREEATIPKLAIQSFSDAFEHAIQSEQQVVYAEDFKLIAVQQGQKVIVKDLSKAYVVPQLKRSVLKRKNKQEVMA